MADDARIEELRRRLQKDPTSIAFAQLAEEYRRAARYREAIETCRTGLAEHPGYLSARVTLGRSLLEIGELEAARTELVEVLRVAPENLAAVRGLAEVHRRRGELPQALEQYRSAFELARNDPGIEQLVREIRTQIEPGGHRPGSAHAVPPPAPAPPPRPAPVAAHVVPPSAPAPPPRPAPVALPAPAPDPIHQAATLRARRVVQHLERWLAAILAERRARLLGTT